jgi:hypothetical protein
MRYLILLLFLSSCTPQKRLERLIRKHPELVRVDSVKIIDTIITQSVSIDTMQVMNTYDTFIVNRDRLTVQVIRHQDSIYVYGKCAGDTVVLERKIPVRIIEVKESTSVPWWVYVFLILVLVVLWFR